MSLTIYKPKLPEKYEVPSADNTGFASPAADYMERRLDINDLVLQHPNETFFAKVSGNSMINAGIFDGDMLVVDSLIEATRGKIVVAVVDNELTVKRLDLFDGRLALLPENDDYEPIVLDENTDFQIQGVVSFVIKEV